MNPTIRSQALDRRADLLRHAALSGAVCALILLLFAASAGAYAYTFNDNNEHLVATISSGSSSANLPLLPAQVFALTNSTGTTWIGMRMRLNGYNMYGSFCCEGFANYSGPGSAYYSDADGDAYGRAEIMRIFLARIPDGSTLNFTVDIVHMLPEGLTDLDIYGRPIAMFVIDREIPWPFDSVPLYSADGDGLIMARQPIHVVNTGSAVWKEFHLNLHDLSGGGGSVAGVRFVDTDGDGVIYSGPGTPILRDVDGVPGADMLVISNVHVLPGESLDVEIDFAGDLTAQQSDFELVGRAITNITGVGDDANPKQSRLNVEFDPNPFNPITNVSFSLPAAAHVSIDIFSARGRRVRQLLAADLAAGQHRVAWNGTDDTGSALASGTYRVLIRAGDEVRSLAVTLVK